MVYQTVGKILNLNSSITSLQDLMSITRQGLSREAVDLVAELLELSIGELAKYLHISERTLQRYSSNKQLSPDISDRLVQIVKVYAKTFEVFEDRVLAIKWLKEPNIALGNIAPIQYLDNSSGIEIVLDELTRIEYGVFA